MAGEGRLGSEVALWSNENVWELGGWLHKSVNVLKATELYTLRKRSIERGNYIPIKLF